MSPLTLLLYCLVLFISTRAILTRLAGGSLPPRLIRLATSSLIRLTVLVRASPYATTIYRLINRFLPAVTDSLSRLVTEEASAVAVACTLAGCIDVGGGGESMMVTFVTTRHKRYQLTSFPTLSAQHTSLQHQFQILRFHF